MLLILSGSSTHMNVEEVGADTMAGRHAPWGALRLPIKAPLSSSQSTPPREGSLSPFRISPWSRISEIHVPGGFSGRICCFRCFTGARARRLSGYPDVCAITDAPLLCGAGRDGAGPDGLCWNYALEA